MSISMRERENYICRKRYNKNNPSSPVVAYNICDEWYPVECIRFSALANIKLEVLQSTFLKWSRD